MTTDSAVSLADRLLDAAEEEITENGNAEVSLRAIARRAGVSHQAPGYVFVDRAGLLAALAARGYAIMNQAISVARAAQPDGSSARSRLVEMGVVYVLATVGRPALFRYMTRSELPGTSTDLAATRAAAIDTLLDAVRDAQAEGWRADERPENLAAVCWSTAHGLASLYSDGGLGHLLAEDIADTARAAMHHVTGH